MTGGQATSALAGVGELRRVAAAVGVQPSPMEAHSGAAAPHVRAPAGRRILGWQPTDFLSRVVVAALFAALAVRIGANAAETGQLTGLLLVASEGLVVILMIVRREAGEVDRTWIVRAVTLLSIAGPPLVRPIEARAGGEDLFTAAFSALGLSLVIASKVTLGRSFGLVPANRGIVSSGPYRFVRHPIYVGYLVTHVAFVIANPLLWNFVVLAAADIALVLRSMYEERTLDRDVSYLAYKGEVRWRLVPGVF